MTSFLIKLLDFHSIIDFLKREKIFLISCAFFFLGIYYFKEFTPDDTFISLRYVEHLLEGKGLTWNDFGKPVEGYSNFLWVLLISFLGLFNVPLFIAARFLGIIFSLFTLYIVNNYYQKKHYSSFSIFIGLICLALSPSFLAWSIGGLETPSIIFLNALIFYLLFRDHPKDFLIDLTNANRYRNILISILFGLLGISRPDGILFFLGFFVFVFLVFLNEKISAQLFFKYLFNFFPTIGIVGIHLIFRFFYYGELVPNTAHVKFKIDFQHFLLGFRYFIHFIIQNPVFILSIFFALKLLYRARSKKILYITIQISIWTLYIILIGGDFFPGYRHFLINIFFSSILLIEIINQCQTKSLTIIFSLKHYILSFIFLLTLNYLQTMYGGYKRIKLEIWAKDALKLGEILRETFRSEKPLIAVTAAGSIPFASKLPAIDMLGLNDSYISKNSPNGINKVDIGHDLGDPNYILVSNPDIIIFTQGSYPDFVIGELLVKDKRFLNEFVEAHIKTFDGVEYILYFNKNGNKLGIKKKNSSIEIPSYLFSPSKKFVLEFSKDKKINLNVPFEGITLSFKHHLLINFDVTVDKINNLAIKNLHDDFIISIEKEFKSNEFKIHIHPKTNKTLQIESVLINLIKPSNY